MAKFKMNLRVDVHDHSSAAHRTFIGQMLDQVKHAVGDGVSTFGSIETPASGAQPRRTVGSWEIEN